MDAEFISEIRIKILPLDLIHQVYNIVAVFLFFVFNEKSVIVIVVSFLLCWKFQWQTWVPLTDHLISCLTLFSGNAATLYM
jgi:hypothetical protein